MLRPSLLIFFAVLLRVALLPVRPHGDLLFIHYFPSFLTYQGIWDIYGHFGNFYLQKGFTYYPPLLYYVVAFWQKITISLNPGFDQFMERADAVMRSGQGNFYQFFPEFSTGELSRYFVMMKLPFFFAEMAILVVLGWLTKDRGLRDKLRISWVWNPVAIYSIYLFSQYRSMTALLAWIIIAAVQQNRTMAGAFLLGLLCLLDGFAPLLALPTLLWMDPTWRGRFKCGLAMAGPIILLLGLLIPASQGYVLNCYFSPTVMKMATQSIFKHYAAHVAVACKILFTSGYILIVLEALFNSKKADISTRPLLWNRAILSILLLLHATSTTHVHYFMWTLPFFLWRTALEPERFPRYLVWAYLGILFLFNLEFASGAVVSGSRMLFSIMSLFFIYRLYREPKGQNENSDTDK